MLQSWWGITLVRTVLLPRCTYEAITWGTSAGRHTGCSMKSGHRGPIRNQSPPTTPMMSGSLFTTTRQMPCLTTYLPEHTEPLKTLSAALRSRNRPNWEGESELLVRIWTTGETTRQWGWRLTMKPTLQLMCWSLILDSGSFIITCWVCHLCHHLVPGIFTVHLHCVSCPSKICHKN